MAFPVSDMMYCLRSLSLRVLVIQPFRSMRFSLTVTAVPAMFRASAM